MGMLGVSTTVDCAAAGPSRTKQSFAAECDIKKIVAKFAKTGMIRHLNAKAPFYGDVSNIVNYQESLGVVMEAQELFRGLSADIRNRFENDPQKLINFLNNPANLKEAQELGIVKKPPTPPVPAAPPAPPT